MIQQSFNTRAVHGGRHDLVDLGVHAVPLDLSTTYPSRDSRGEAARLEILGTGEMDSGMPVYGRLGNPTVARFEEALADLEGCEAAVAFASGMAALSACLLAAVSAQRPHVVAIRPLYGTSDFLIDSGLLGTHVTWATPDTLRASMRPDTGLVIVETPANPTLGQVNIAAMVESAGPVPVLVDNTFATPVFQRPAEHGAQIVLHSATKFLGGHGDVMGGVVACSKSYARTLRQLRFATGGVLHPLAGYLLLRGLATLPVRMRAAAASAEQITTRLAAHEGVRNVQYPRPDIADTEQMSSGGALVSFEVVGDPHAVIAAVRLITPAVSLGSVDSLIQHPGSLSHHIIEPEQRNSMGISDNLLRLSVGLEDVDDLWADLSQALDASAH